MSKEFIKLSIIRLLHQQLKHSWFFGPSFFLSYILVNHVVYKRINATPDVRSLLFQPYSKTRISISQHKQYPSTTGSYLILSNIQGILIHQWDCRSWLYCSSWWSYLNYFLTTPWFNHTLTTPWFKAIPRTGQPLLTFSDPFIWQPHLLLSIHQCL